MSLFVPLPWNTPFASLHLRPWGRLATFAPRLLGAARGAPAGLFRSLCAQEQLVGAAAFAENKVSSLWL